ncbi:sigma-54 dependent transcriptional regulator [Gilvimarinus sp. SDUM040013]|uniref:Sigma-54 dependent transcriptional regulator n=1 Tax=Gilvimarinus gilvus TaxID=3058038 RepID=A0ABU4RV21_9GAMM|nr:sigma-54 dependent transcriptional regulator [Gilvimarinus sp. SDUM040013]MDO3387899.1 sigma-54 dependent transcriptional regulator [Gilvimarinus sp. SDUM040013]MDX6848730.1 sigma-54 dependent transcriptional regulator [Gilvimarinus sp. SDUM040013]
MDTAGAHLLVVDDKPENLDILVHYLASSGFELAVATDGEQALDIAAQQPPELVLLDVMMPGLDGFEVCRRLKADATTADIPVIFMSALGDTESKVSGFSAGAVDYISKPLQREEVLARINTHLTLTRQNRQLQENYQALASLNAQLQEQIDRRLEAEDQLLQVDQQLSALSNREAKLWGIEAFVGQSRKVCELLEDIRSLQQAGNTNVLVLGESGTGKELVSRSIHFGSERCDKPFIAVNCSAVPAELADAEFFGHVKGAFTGANSDRLGFFASADGGTLFLDEIGDMPLSLQAKLLRVLEDGMVVPVGGRKARKVDVRVVAATNVHLQERVSRKQFRQDLYFRLAGYVLTLPALRERTADIPLLVSYFAEQLAGQMGREVPTISADAMARLRCYHYPGNVRELRNLLEYALIASRGRPIQANHLHFLEPPIPPAGEPIKIGRFDSDVAVGGGETDEAQVLDLAAQQQRVDNALVQQHLGVDHARASYLLKKLHKEGHLAKCGERRWTHYVLE